MNDDSSSIFSTNGGGSGVRIPSGSARLLRGIDEMLGHPDAELGRNKVVTPEGKLLEKSAYEKQLAEWIPSESDRAYVRSLMNRVVEPGKMASWIAPPERGINNLAIDYEYVKLH